jgi:hypothetical protein
MLWIESNQSVAQASIWDVVVLLQEYGPLYLDCGFRTGFTAGADATPAVICVYSAHTIQLCSICARVFSDVQLYGVAWVLITVIEYQYRWIAWHAAARGTLRVNLRLMRSC